MNTTSLEEVARKLMSELPENYIVTEKYQSDGLYHFHTVQAINNIPIANTHAQFTLNDQGKVVSSTASWPTISSREKRALRKRSNPITPIDALMVFASVRGISIQAKDLKLEAKDGHFIITFPDKSWATSEATVKSQYYKTESDLQLAWDISFPTKENYWNFFVSQSTGKLLGVANWVYRLTKRSADPPRYKVFRLGKGNPAQSSPVVVKSPSDSLASPKGWHYMGEGNPLATTTEGNNAIVKLNSNDRSGYSPTKPDLNFNYDYTPSEDASKNADAAIVNAFFLANAFHDIMYRYGFDEAAGNFQKYNNGKGGAEGDPIEVKVQDGSDVNNANFASPADGRSGVMKLFIFTKTSPRRDGSLEAPVVIHELMHGVTSRLTGGASNPNCLQTDEALGMSEGWSDVVALALDMTAADTRKDAKAFGSYVSGNEQRGVRTKPYSTDMNVNSFTYGDQVKSENQATHVRGEIWASILFEVYWELVDAFGFEQERGAKANSGKGNTVFLWLIIEGMKLQPCNPTFVQARDAILKADQLKYANAHRCALLKGFAKRGMGLNVKDDKTYINDFAVPAECT